MALISYIEHDGGYSIMQAALDNMLEGIVAECGGACSCATCNCYIDEAWTDKVSPPQAIEKELIEFAIDTKDNSRVSCQLTVTQDLDGLVVHLPESQY